MKEIEMYVHTSKETAYDTCKEAGLSEEACLKGMYLGYEHKLTFLVDEKTGEGKLIKVDDKLIQEQK